MPATKYHPGEKQWEVEIFHRTVGFIWTTTGKKSLYSHEGLWQIQHLENYFRISSQLHGTEIFNPTRYTDQFLPPPTVEMVLEQHCISVVISFLPIKLIVWSWPFSIYSLEKSCDSITISKLLFHPLFVLGT